MTQQPKTLDELTENFLKEVNANCYVVDGVIKITHECLTAVLKYAIRESAEKTVQAVNALNANSSNVEKRVWYSMIKKWLGEKK